MVKAIRKSFIKFIYVSIDFFFICAAILLACFIRESTLPFEVTFYNLFFNPENPYRYLLLFWVAINLIFNNSNDLYETKREILETVEIWQVIKSVFYSSLITIVAIYMVKIPDFPRSIVIMIVILTILFFSLWRILKRMFVQYLVSQGYNNLNALIIGAGKVGLALANEIEKKPQLGIRIVGFLDDFKEDIEDPSFPKIIGKISDFVKIAPGEFINKIFITIHHDSKVFFDLLEQSRDLKIAVHVVPQGYEFMTEEFAQYNIGLIPILEYCRVEDLRKQTGKRIFDMLSSLILLIVSFPLFCLAAFLIKLESPGPVFYLSKRYGKGGRVFYMYKFRTMVADAEKKLAELRRQNEADGPIFKIKNDPRITKMGRLLRKYSLDELPQLFNVFKGDMSLVGPRPFPIDQIEKEDLRQLKRLEVRPGITGLWQIRGRSDLSFARLLKWDLWYINNWSLALDFIILIQTIPVVIKAKGAY